VSRLLAAGVAELPGFQPLGVLFLVLGGRVVAVFTIPALQRNNFPHELIPFSKFLVRANPTQ
jgi:hypothetical protein